MGITDILSLLGGLCFPFLVLFFPVAHPQLGEELFQHLAALFFHPLCKLFLHQIFPSGAHA